MLPRALTRSSPTTWMVLRRYSVSLHFPRPRSPITERRYSYVGSQATSPLHLIGLGATIFLQAALGMEAGVVEEAVKALNEAEAAARAHVKASKTVKSFTRYPPGIEWEVIHTDAVVLQGLTHALSETYYGECIVDARRPT